MVSGNDRRGSSNNRGSFCGMVPDVGGNHCRGAVRVQIKKEPVQTGSGRKNSAWDIFLEWGVPALVSVGTVLITVVILRRLGVT